MHRAPILSVLAIAALGAADGSMELSDLRFNIGSAPLPNHASGYYTEVQSPTPPGYAVGAPRDDLYGTSSGVGTSITGTFGTLAPVGLIWGGGFRYVNGEVPWEATVEPATPGYPATGGILDVSALKASGHHAPAMNYSASGAQVEVGMGLVLGGAWHAELAALGSMDWVTMDFLAIDPTTGTVFGTDGKGLGFTYGARIGFYWTSETQWQFGFGGEWSRSRAMLDVSYTNSTLHTDISATGFSGYGTLGYRF